MTHRVVTTRRADEDIVNVVDHYVHEGAGDVASDWVDALEDAIDLIGDFPSLGSARIAVETGIAELRSIPLGRFPFAILYTHDADAVRIHRVLHTRRDMPVELGDR